MNDVPRRIGVVLHPQRDVSEALARVVAWARAEGIPLVGSEDDRRLPEGVERVPRAQVGAGVELVLALGGDGTMLTALGLATPHGVPALGVNLGRLGYLTEADAEHLPQALAALARGEYEVEARTCLALVPGERCTFERRRAFNDVVLTRVPGRGQAALGLRVDGGLLVRYSSDGVIVATPMGSTAYSFSAGGPIVSPRTQGLIVTPDAPHGFFNRAVVLAEDEVLGVEVLTQSAPLSLEVDGRLIGEVGRGAHMELAAAEESALVVRLDQAGFAERARRKLGIRDPAVLADFDLAGHER